jgi:UMF1 family MFS transporter
MPVRGNRSAIAAWCLFDWANSSFPTIVVTFLFSAYFTKAVAPNPELGTALWGQANSASALVAAFIAPVLGAIADQGGRRKPWLLALSLVCIVATASLWFVRPDASDVLFALLMFGIATLGFELGLVFYNAMLPDLAGPDRVGRISGWGWGLGYLGGLAGLIICLLVFVQPDPAPFGLDRESAEHVRITNPFAALWFAVFALPLFLWTPDRQGSGVGWACSSRPSGSLAPTAMSRSSCAAR